MLNLADWLARLLPGILSAAFFVVAADWLQTRGLNARRRPGEADLRVTDEIAAPATRLHLAAIEICGEMGWQIHARDDAHYILWAINRSPHPGLRNMGLIVEMTPFGSGESHVTLVLNSPHPAWVRSRFRAAAARFLERLRLRAIVEPPAR